MHMSATLVVIAAVTAAATQPQPVYHGRTGSTDVTLPRTDAAITVNGVLDEPVWHEAALLTGFTQYAPVDGAPAADSTEVYVVYGDDAIYFAVRAFEPHGAVTANLPDRDRIDANDQIQIILDTFDDRRRAYVFAASPVGVQADGMFADGGGIDLNPDFIFESRGVVDDSGYTLEFRIPFKSLRFRETDVQSWGLNVLRRVQHSGHDQTWAPVDRGAPSFLAQSGRLSGLTGLRRGLVLDVNPVMTARSTGAPDRAVPGAWSYRTDSPEFGANVRWGVTPNLSLNATVNPDFSQVEADAGQVVYDPRQALAFPEKRPFFLEGNENFQVPNSLIYSRRIVAPEAAAKLIGKVGPLNVGVLSAVDDAGATPGADNPIFNIVRLRRDLGAQSNVGVVYTDRVIGSDWNRVVGGDTRLLLGTRHILSAQLAGSFTRSTAMRPEGRPLFDFSLIRTGREAGFSATLEGVHPSFVAGSGFIPRAGIVHANISPRRTFFPKSGAIESLTVVLPILDGTWDWDRFMAGTEPNDIKVNSSTQAVFRGGWRAHLYTWAESFKYSPAHYAAYYIAAPEGAGRTDTVQWQPRDRLPNFGAMTSLTTPQWQKFTGSIEFIGGQDVNYDEWSSAWIAFISVDAEWRPTDRLRLGARHIEQRFHRRSDGSLVRRRMIPRVKLEYQVSRPVFFRFVGQYDALTVDALRDDDRTDAPILLRRADGTFRPATAVNRDGFRADWLFSWQPNPGTVFFAGYGTSMSAPGFLSPDTLQRTDDGFFIKLSYLLRM